MNTATPAAGQGETRFLAPLLLLFVGSGCAALMYEIVWFQTLQLVIGSSAVSLGVLLGTFMGGMCLGSVFFPRLVSPRWHPLRVYALLEAAIGLLGLTLLVVLPYAGAAYVGWVGHGSPALLLRSAICAICLLPPTVLMGATLPAIARWMESTRQGIAQLGFFYGMNIVGAVFGCLVTGFYLLRIHDTGIATYAAVTINSVIALLGFVLATRAPWGPPPAAEPLPPESQRGWARYLVYVAIALSGLTALGAEVIWTRILSLLLGATVYTFSIILAVFLIGLGLGSSVGSVLAHRSARPGLWLALAQCLLTGAILWGAYSAGVSLPYWPIDVTLAVDPWHVFQLDIMRCVWALLPAATLWVRVFLWRWRQPPETIKIRAGWWAECMRPIRSER